jgi:short-subunit dehydrogenase
MQLKGDKVLLTGGSGALGALIAERLARRGADVTVLGREPSLRYQARIIHADLATPEGVEAAAAQVAQEPWDGLINLAGVQHFGPFESQASDHLLATYMVNLVAPARLAQAVLPAMKAKKRGRIVNVGSIFGSINSAHFVSYSSSKAGLHGLSQGLRRELAGSGVRVTYVAPRAVNTPFNSERVLAFAAATKMHMDAPKRIARRIVTAMERCEREVFLGFPEAFFVKVNGLAPGIVDGALKSKTRAAGQLFVAA